MIPLICLILVTGLSACDNRKKPPVGVIGHAGEYFGGAAADEPQAVLIARDILSAGGTASDAAIAMTFALSVTYPSAAGIGGGGVCSVYDVRLNEMRTLDFRAKAPPGALPEGKAPALIPGVVRGMAVLHARYGALRWEQLVEPAERLARFGIPISRAFAREVEAGFGRIADPAALTVFSGTDGQPLKEGTTIRRLGLATALGRIRAQGAGEFYGGLLARQIAEAVQSTGGHLTIDHLRAYRPAWLQTTLLKAGDHEIAIPGPSVPGGKVMADLWRRLAIDGDWSSSEVESAGSVAAAMRQVGGSTARADGVLGDDGTVGFAIIDLAGGAAACTLTLNGRFGQGRMMPGLDILMAEVPIAGAPDPGRMLAPVVVANTFTRQGFLALSGSGNEAATMAAIGAAVRFIREKDPISEVLAAPRLYPVADEATDLGDRNAPGAARQVPALGRVNVAYCSNGGAREPETCRFGTDPRGFGYAISADR